ncbi:unnamed protein product [Polarella glacialis]|uniref:J domain-containing protein n=1 Tax=Polarella glacialis TaxID=89957 RepID=A0A813JXF9_POLGL|nr:unnamed protein product [Polarella glacialis]
MAGTPLNLYGALGMDESASESDVRSAYRRRALATHPDKGGEAEVFRLVVKAFEVLGDAARRATYDRKLRLLRGEGGQGRGNSPASSLAAASAAPAVAQASRTERAQQKWGPQAAACSGSPPCHAEARQQQAPSQAEALPKEGRSASTGAQPASTSEDCAAGPADRTTAAEILLKLMGMEKAAARTQLQILQAGVLRQLVALLSSEDQPDYNESMGPSGLPCTEFGSVVGGADTDSCSSGSDANCQDPEPLLAIEHGHKALQ